MKSIKIFKAFSAYQTYLDRFYVNNPIVAHDSFDKQLEFFRKDNFPWILSWNPYNNDDRVDVFETIHNDFYLQNAWANDRYNNTNWQIEIIIEQIKSIQPDVCVIYPPEFFTSDIVDYIRSIQHKPILVGGYDGMGRNNISLYKNYDFVITCSSYISSYYKQQGMQTYPLYFGFEKSCLKQIGNSIRSFDVSFSGSIFPNVHKERLTLLNYIAKHSPLILSSEFQKDSNFPIFSKKFIKSIMKNDVSDYLALRRICNRNIGPLYGNEMFQFLHDSKVSINKHGDNINFAANVRLFEATGVGTCLLTDWKENICDFFEPDKEIVTFNSKEEAVDKIKFLLKHDDFRKNVAFEGQKRTLAEYTYDKRIPGVIDYIKKLL